MSTITDGLVRRVTAAEVETFQRDGWAFLPGYVDPAHAAEMLAFVQRALGEEGLGQAPSDLAKKTTFVEAGFWRDWRFLARDASVEPFRRLCFGGAMGSNAFHLMARHVAVRFDVDGLLLKLPAGGRQGSSPTDWHQDWPNQSHDRVGGMSFWIALNDVPAERGSMRFLTGSHREGPLGRTLRGGTDLVRQYPELLERYTATEPMHYRPGDASVHNGLIVHSAPANRTDTPRWAYAMSCFPADACYTGAAFSNTDGLGLEVGAPLDHLRFPILFDPETVRA
jgi:Phytanoyl-CoA dioxygenase (PhyH)